jgi:type IV pili sensor histidine kinase/response regulator
MQGVSMKQGFFCGLIAVVLMVPTTWAQTRQTAGTDQVQVGRYTTQSAQPSAELGEPLSVNAQINFPRQTVSTVGQALDYTLIRTGYRMVDPMALSEQARSFLSLPLPESQRRMGPYSAKNILRILLGSAWTLKTDPITRQVWFELAGAVNTPTVAQTVLHAPELQPAAPANAWDVDPQREVEIMYRN